MVWNALALLAGVLWVETRPELAGIGRGIATVALMALVCAWIAIRRPARCFTRVAVSLGVLAAGIWWTQWRAAVQFDSQRLEDTRSFEGEIAGTVASIPEGGGDRLQFDFEPLAPRVPGLPRRLRLTWYDAPSMPRPTERWRLQVRLRPPHGFANPGGFDYEGQLFREGIGAVGYVRQSERNRRLDGASWRRPVLRIRAAIVDRMQQALGDSPARGVAIGLAVGATHEISPEQWQVFRATGITHLIAISGLHVTMIAVLGMLLVRVWWWFPWQPQMRSCRNDIAAAVGAIAAAGYALLAGFSVPTQRTLVMFLAVLASLWLRRAQPPVSALSMALIAVLIFDPHAVLAPGFWLSFLCVAAILWSVGGRRHETPPKDEGRVARLRARVMRAVRTFFTVQGAVTVMLLPATLLLFGSVSIVAPAVNVLAIPYFGWLLVPAILLSVALMAVLPSAGAALLKGAALSFEFVWPVLDGAAKLPGAWLQLPEPGVLLITTLAVTAVMVVAPLPLRLRACGLLALAPLFFHQPHSPSDGGVQLSVLDVGQGLAVFVRTRNHSLLYDAGPSFRSGRSAGDLAVVPFLSNRGVKQLDMVVISHPDSDHAGGALAVVQAVPLRALRHGGALDVRLRREAGAVDPQPCQQGEAWTWDGVRFEFLHPRAQQQWSDNDGSCLLSITARGGRVLLTGDLQSRAEKHLVEQHQVPKADIVIVAHHGSRSSSTQAFVDAIQARYAVVSAGHLNRWGMPDANVVRRWCLSGAQVLGTTEWGAVSMAIDPQRGIELPQSYRAEYRRYWHATTAAAGRSLCVEGR